jgi:hypothetical protein
MLSSAYLSLLSMAEDTVIAAGTTADLADLAGMLGAAGVARSRVRFRVRRAGRAPRRRVPRHRAAEVRRRAARAFEERRTKACSAHSRARGNPDLSFPRPWIPAFAGMSEIDVDSIPPDHALETNVDDGAFHRCRAGRAPLARPPPIGGRSPSRQPLCTTCELPQDSAGRHRHSHRGSQD